MAYKKELFDPKNDKPIKISRSKIDLFINCPRCFYLDKRLGISRPQFPAFTLNNAVDTLLKKEFDIHRAQKETHPLMKTYGIEAIPFEHSDMNIWRENFKGIQVHHQPSNLIITGAVDDIWINSKNELHVVDYKSTSKDEEIKLNSKWHEAYKRQVEIYQWLLRQKGFKVSNTAYFVYANAQKDKKAFDGKLEFDVTIIAHQGNDSWIEKAILDLKKCLLSEKVPPPAKECEYCEYRKQIYYSVEEQNKK